MSSAKSLSSSSQEEFVQSALKLKTVQSGCSTAHFKALIMIKIHRALNKFESVILNILFPSSHKVIVNVINIMRQPCSKPCLIERASLIIYKYMPSAKVSAVLGTYIPRGISHKVTLLMVKLVAKANIVQSWRSIAHLRALRILKNNRAFNQLNYAILIMLLSAIIVNLVNLMRYQQSMLCSFNWPWSKTYKSMPSAKVSAC
jgi:hypothetical protein